MSGVYTFLGATTPAGTPEATTELLTAVPEEHTDLDRYWVTSGSHQVAAEGGEPGGVMVYIAGRQKYTVAGLDEAAVALSRALRYATALTREEWSDDELGGSERVYRDGQPIRRRTLDWHDIPLE